MDEGQSSLGAGSDGWTSRTDPESAGDFPQNGHTSRDTIGDTHDDVNLRKAALSGRPRPPAVPKMEEIPLVTDETGERVRESFGAFLERFVNQGCSHTIAAYHQIHGRSAFSVRIHLC